MNPIRDVQSDNPFLQRQMVSEKGGQIDYLIQTKFKNLYVCEVKFSINEITHYRGNTEKIVRLQLPRGTSALPVLIHVNGVSESVRGRGYFYEIIDFRELVMDLNKRN